MPKYLIFDADVLNGAVVVETENVDSAEAAVQSVPSTTRLPDSAIIVPRARLETVTILPAGSPEPKIVRRP